MSSRVVGAGLALIAAALFAVSIATPAVLPPELSLFAGHRTVNGHTLEMQDAYVGLYRALVCNTGGDGTCQNANPQIAFKIVAFAELGVTGLAGVLAGALAVLTLRKSERRKGVARFVRILGVIAAAGAGAMIILGPTDQGSIPLGLGMGLYGAGILSAVLASVIAVRSAPPIKLRVADRGVQRVAAMPARPPVAAMPAPLAAPAPPPFDMQALFGEDPVRPGEVGPEPMMRRDAWAQPAPPPGGGEFDGPADPFATTSSALPGIPGLAGPSGGDRPLFAAAPQLRPLYDATPLQGGTGGLLPVERPVIATRPPAPVSRAPINASAASAATGLPTAVPLLRAERPKTLPPPNFGARGKPASMPPPLPPGAAPRTQVSMVPPMPEHDVPVVPPVASPVASIVPPSPGLSDGSPEAAEAPANTEPNVVPVAEDPPQVPRAPVPRPRVETPLAPPPPPVVPEPRSRRASPSLPRPLHDTQSPRPGLRAAVPMPERTGRSAPGSTRPPPLAMAGPLGSPLRVAPPRPTMTASVAPPPSIPPIPAIPAIPMLPSRAETDPHDRAETFDQGLDPITGSHDPIEIGDHTSQTNVSFGMVTAEEFEAAVEAVGAPLDPPPGGSAGAAAAEIGFSETTTASEPLEPLDDADRALGASDTRSAPASPPAGAPTSPLPSVAVAPDPLVRDRPMPKLPITTAPDSLPPPKDNKRQTGPSPACPQCESPMAWVEEHLRFYCKSCRMYF
jgi:hypothetical protein